VTPYMVGTLLAVAVAALGRVRRFDRDRSLYSTILFVIASCYMLFAIMGDSTGALVGETVIAILFFSDVCVRRAAVSAADRNWHCRPWTLRPDPPWHYPRILVSLWWPGFCMRVDLVLGLWVSGLYRSRQAIR
jgi:hypothetical protein